MLQIVIYKNRNYYGTQLSRELYNNRDKTRREDVYTTATILLDIKNAGGKIIHG
jgi:hypothetical protein